jgi:glycosyltransferase involved in cell wall biosynthesis
MSAARQVVAILSFSPIYRDARLQRQIHALAEDHELVVVGYGNLGHAAALPRVRMVSLSAPRHSLMRSAAVLGAALLGRAVADLGYPAWSSINPEHRAAERALVAAQPALIVANDWQALPAAVRAARRAGARVVADLHEYAPVLWDHDKVRKQLFAPLIDYHLRAAQPRLAAAVTVNQTIAERYRELYGIDCEVVRNIPSAREPEPFRPTDPSAIRLVHHGVANRERRLDRMIEAVALCPPHLSLHFMLVDQDGGLQELKDLASRVAPGRIHFDPVVKPHEIVPTIARFDVGFYLLTPGTFNQHAALPNKYFEFLFAGLAVCVGPSPEMARLTREHGCGVVTPSFEPAAAADVLRKLEPSAIDEMKRRSIQACASLRPEHEASVMREVVNRALHAERAA